MTRLLHDRFYRYADDRAWDLTTGDSVPVAGLTDAAPTSADAPEPIVEVLDHGRDGEPRWIVVDAAGRSSAALARRVADDARARGLVPVGADVYLRLGRLLDEELRHRTLMIIVGPDGSIEAGRRALLEAAARSPRPHVLVSFRSAQGTRSPTTTFVVREARSAYVARVQPRSPGVEDVRPRWPEDVHRQIARGERSADLCRTGRHAAAERLLREVVGALLRRRAFEPAARTLISLGRIHLERGRALAADAAFTEAAGHAQTSGHEALTVEARLWLASARTDAGQLTSAESLCRAALIVGITAGGLRARAEAGLARVLLWQNRVEEAAACDLRVDHDDEEVHAVAGSIAVRVHVAQGDLFSAGQRARELLDRLDRTGHPLIRVIALATHLRVVLETGDLELGAQGLRALEQAARLARTPLRYLRARLLWVDALRRAGRVRDSERELVDLQRLKRATPPLLASAIEGRVRPESRSERPVVSCGDARLAATMVELARDEAHDHDAVRRVMERLARVLRASRLDVWSAAGGPDSIVVSAGSGLVTTVGPRVLDTGIAISDGRDTREVGVPVRVGARLVAALVARWPVDRPVSDRARELLLLGAAIAAPRIDAMRAATQEAAAVATAIPELVGVSTAMADVRRAITRAASAPFSVLIEGESGSGKELVARALHQLSPRRERRFCDLNCAALPDELVEAELFGHTRGAFTGAVTDRPGLLEEADGGTLFLDEVADLSLRAQAKLLRVLQQQEVRRVGASLVRKIDVRVISAANREMRAEVSAGRFRPDLLYRLDVIRIRVPPLRERPEDVSLLARHFWTSAAERTGTRAGLSHAVLAALSRYDWPGNVRELQNVIAGLAVSAPASGHVRPALLPAAIAGAATFTPSLVVARGQFERRFIEAALARAGGRRARAARDLGLSRQGLLKIMARLGIGAAEAPR